MTNDYMAMRDAALALLDNKVRIRDYRGAVLVCDTQLVTVKRRLDARGDATQVRGWLLIQGALLARRIELLELYAKHMPYSYTAYMKGGE